MRVRVWGLVLDGPAFVSMVRNPGTRIAQISCPTASAFHMSIAMFRDSAKSGGDSSAVQSLLKPQKPQGFCSNPYNNHGPKPTFSGASRAATLLRYCSAEVGGRSGDAGQRGGLGLGVSQTLRGLGL